MPATNSAFAFVRRLELLVRGRSGAFAMVGYPPRVLEPGDLVSDRPFWEGVVIDPASSVAEPGMYRLRAAVRVVSARDYTFSSPLEVTIVP